MPDPVSPLATWLADPVSAWGGLPPASDHISIVGLVLTLGGLAWSVRMAWRAKSAAELAERAARDASEDLLRHQDSVRVETAFQKVAGILEVYRPTEGHHLVPPKIMALIEDLDRLRVGPHFKNSQSSETIQRYIRALGMIHGQITQSIPEDADDLQNRENQTRYEMHHKLLINLHSYLRDLESETYRGDKNGTH